MQQVVFTLNFKHTFTPLYHPQANTVERRNRDLKTQLAILVQESKHNCWSERLPAIRFAMNSTNWSSTSYTPAYLAFGRELRAPRDNEVDFRNILISENKIPEITSKLLTLTDTLKRAREVQECKEEQLKGYTDQHWREHPQYQTGDLVLVSAHPISRVHQGVTAKFSLRRDGPYVIVKQQGPASFKVASTTSPDEPIGLYHTSALTPYYGEDKVALLREPAQPLRRRGAQGRAHRIRCTSSTQERTRTRTNPRKFRRIQSPSPRRLRGQRRRLWQTYFM